MRNESNSG